MKGSGKIWGKFRKALVKVKDWFRKGMEKTY